MANFLTFALQNFSQNVNAQRPAQEDVKQVHVRKFQLPDDISADNAEKFDGDVYPSTSELASISQLVYEPLGKFCEGLKTKHPRMEVLDVLPRYQKKWRNKDAEGYKDRTECLAAAIFRKNDTTIGRRSQLIIAFRGTTDRKDMIADFYGVVNNEVIPELTWAAEFTKRVIQRVQEVLKGLIFSITITGHSLGGWLAQGATFLVKYKTKDFEKLYPHCEVFDSPGAFQIIQCLRIKWRVDSQEKINLDITNYVMYPNIVNVMNQHFGNLVYLQPTDESEKTIIEKKALWKRFVEAISERITLTLEHHPISHIVQLLDKNYRKSHLVNWPLVIFKGPDTLKESLGFEKALRIVRNCRIFTRQLDEFIKNEDILKDWLGDLDSVSVDLVTISDQEKNIIAEIRFLIRYCKLFPINIIPKSALNEHLQKISEDFKMENGRQIFGNWSNYSTVKNLLLCNTHLNYETLKDSTEVSYTLRTEMHIEEINTFYAVELQPASPLDMFELRNEIRDGRQYALRLMAYKIALYISKYGKDENMLMIRYEDVLKQHKTNTGIKYKVIVDGTSDPQGRERIPVDLGENYETFWLIYDKIKHCPLVDQFLGTEEVQTDALKQEICIHGNICEIGDIIDASVLQNKDFLRHHFEIYENLIRRTPEKRVEVGSNLPRLTYLNYFYVQLYRKFQSLEEIMQLFETGEGQCILIFHGDIQKVKEQDITNQKLLTLYLADSPEFFLEFKKICTTYSDSTLNLIRVDTANAGSRLDVSQTFTWSHQYNPGLYMERALLTPPLQLQILLASCTHQKFNIFRYTSIYQEWKDASVADIDEQAVAPYAEKSTEVKIRIDGENYCQTEFIELDEAQIKSTKAFYFNSTKKLPELELSDYTNISSINHMIICDEPGMGKTLFCIRLCNILAQVQTPKLFVNFVELKYVNFKSLLEEANTFTDQTVTLRLKKLFKLSDFEEFCFSQILYGVTSSKLVLVFDAYDEITDNESRNRFLDFLSELKKLKNLHIIVSTRRQNIEQLELTLGVLSHNIVPINTQHQVKFLSDVWKSGCVKGNTNVNRVGDFATQVIAKAEGILKLNDENNNFLGIPLQLKMLSDVFKDQCEIFVTTVGNADQTGVNLSIDEILGENYTLNKLFREYIDEKFRIYFCEKLRVARHILNPILQSLKTETYFYEISKETLQLNEGYSDMLKLVFDSRIGTKFDEGKEMLLGTGIVQEVVQDSSSFDEMQFLHRTFAEYYFAEALFCMIMQFCVEFPNEYTKNNYCVFDLFELIYKAVDSYQAASHFLNNFIAESEELVRRMARLQIRLDLEDEEMSKLIKGFDENRDALMANECGLALFSFLCTALEGDEMRGVLCGTYNVIVWNDSISSGGNMLMLLAKAEVISHCFKYRFNFVRKHFQHLFISDTWTCADQDLANDRNAIIRAREELIEPKRRRIYEVNQADYSIDDPERPFYSAEEMAYFMRDEPHELDQIGSSITQKCLTYYFNGQSPTMKEMEEIEKRNPNLYPPSKVFNAIFNDCCTFSHKHRNVDFEEVFKLTTAIPELFKGKSEGLSKCEFDLEAQLNAITFKCPWHIKGCDF